MKTAVLLAADVPTDADQPPADLTTSDHQSLGKPEVHVECDELSTAAAVENRQPVDHVEPEVPVDGDELSSTSVVVQQSVSDSAEVDGEGAELSAANEIAALMRSSKGKRTRNGMRSKVPPPKVLVSLKKRKLRKSLQTMQAVTVIMYQQKVTFLWQHE